MAREQSFPIALYAARRTRTVEGLIFTLATSIVIVSAILTKQTSIHGQRMMSLTQINSLYAVAPELLDEQSDESGDSIQTVSLSVFGEDDVVIEPEPDEVFPIETRWFDGRPIRPARVLWMTVTAYSPDERSCGKFADGQTATLHSVWTNGMRIVAADTSVLAYGSMLTVPGYADDSVVPVLDCGSAIKGSRLDVLFATHEQALRWGVRRLRVVVWGYADGLPAPNPREVR